MDTKQVVAELVYDAIDNVNMQVPSDQRLKKSPNTVLFGESSRLSSLGLVELILSVEERIDEKFGVVVNLADDKAMSRQKSPFRTVDSIIEYAVLLLNENERR